MDKKESTTPPTKPALSIVIPPAEVRSNRVDSPVPASQDTAPCIPLLSTFLKLSSLTTIARSPSVATTRPFTPPNQIAQGDPDVRNFLWLSLRQALISSQTPGPLTAFRAPVSPWTPQAAPVAKKPEVKGHKRGRHLPLIGLLSTSDPPAPLPVYSPRTPSPEPRSEEAGDDSEDGLWAKKPAEDQKSKGKGKEPRGGDDS